MRPCGLNTTFLLKSASQQLGMSPQHTLSVAEKLYLGGYITYPRSETTAYNDDFDFVGVLSALMNNDE
jgi:DNA topoisomerase-3